MVETDEGDCLLAEAGVFWALFTYVQGTDYDYAREGQVRSAARWLARFHTASEGFHLPEVVGDTIPDVRRWWTEGEGELTRLEEMFRGLGVEGELAWLRQWRSELVREWPLATLDALPVCWVHGDYHGRNTVFAGDRLAGLFDFDVVHRGFRVEDVAHGVFAFGRERRGAERIRPEAARLFLREYRREMPLTDAERRAIPMMAVLVLARTSARYALRQRDGEDPVRIFRAHVRLMRALSASCGNGQTRKPVGKSRRSSS